MANNFFKPTGPTSASQPDAGGAVIKQVPLFGVVKDNIDTIRAGRLRVYISDMGGSNPDDSTTWVTVNYMSPFYGMTDNSGDKSGYGSYLQNPASYGMWNSPPDIGTTVICLFINGDPNYGYWIGCVPEPEALYMIPAIGASETVVTNEGESGSYGGATRLPVTNINSNNDKLDKSAEFFSAPKPVHSYVAGVLFQQGLLRDTVRGAIGTSAQRESPSRVGWGVSTPGRPIYEGGFDDSTISKNLDKNKAAQLKVINRRAGHTFVMDDGDLNGKDQLIRMRTALGHQILMSDDGQCLFIIHANGQSWIELGKEGTIDMYATNSVNIRSQGDLNFHADNNINLNAAKGLNIAAENINVNSSEKTSWRTGSDFLIQSLAKFGVNSAGASSIKADGDVSISGATAYVTGSKVNLNTGSAAYVPGAVTPITQVAHTDTLFDSKKGWLAAPGKLLSIVSRAPAHSPWASAGQGVDVKVNNDASANFPSAPTPAVAAVNTAVPSTPPVPVATAAAATVPVVGQVSGALDKTVSATMVSQVATIAQTGPAASAIATGKGIVGTGENAVAAIGKLAQSPQQLETANILKPGAGALVGALISQGKSLTQAMTSNLFTGKPGAENITTYLNNQPAQVNTQLASFQNVQSTLTKSGIITGKEAPSQIAGLITAGVTSGVKATVNFVSNASKNIGSLASGASGSIVSGAKSLFGSVQNAISSGNFAANQATNVTGGLSSLSASLSGLANSAKKGVSGLLDSAKGVAGSAFAAISSSLPKLKAGEPQNLKQISDKAIADAQGAGSESASLLSKASTALSAAGDKAKSIASGVASSAMSGISSVATGIKDVSLATAKAVLPTSVASGLGLLPGSSNAVASVVNNSKNAINSIPGTSEITGAIKQVASSTNGKNSESNILNASSIASGAQNLLNSAGGVGGLAKGAATLAQVTGASGLAGAATILKGADGVLGQLKNPNSSLSKLAVKGLPPSALASLNASISALSSGGPGAVKMPTVSTGTNDRGSVNSQVSTVLGSSKIPPPVYDALNVSDAELAAIDAKKEKRATLIKEVDAQKELVLKIREDYQNAINTLPPGDPGIVEQREKYYAEKAKWSDLLSQLAEA